MQHINIEIKAKSENHNQIRKILNSKNAEFKGVDYQIDTYFKVNFGRLKLREGNIENYLIYYNRENKKGPKQSDILLYKTNPSNLKEILENSLEILVVVDKKREIYFIDNIKFHLDNVKNLGTFVEIEAIDYERNLDKSKLLKQCNKYLDLFNIPQDNLISVSYSDLLLQKNK